MACSRLGVSRIIHTHSQRFHHQSAIPKRNSREEREKRCKMLIKGNVRVALKDLRNEEFPSPQRFHLSSALG